MSEIVVVNLPEKDPGFQLSDLSTGDVFIDMDGDFGVMLEDGIINIEENGTVTVYTFEEAEKHKDVFGKITLMPSLQCIIEIVEIEES